MVDILAILQSIDRNVLMIAIIAILVIEVFLLSFPKEIVMVFAGIAFGIAGGTILNLIGLFGAAWLGYEGGRLGKFGVERLRGHRLVVKYKDQLERRGNTGLSLLRLIPLTPNDILSITCGFVEFRKKPYLIISFITAIPYAFLWAYVGDKGVETLMETIPTAFDPTLWLLSFILVILLFWVLSKRLFVEENE